jgi:hypothetical protein
MHSNFLQRNGEMPVKIFVDTNGMVHLNCPYCRDVSERPVRWFHNIPQPLQISCACGKVYEAQIEFRKSFRKKAHLDGFYSRATPPGSFEKMTITDISMGGCRFLTSNRYLVKKDDRVKLVFNLDNTDHTKITKEAVICSFDGQSVGCKFLVTGNDLDPDIGFYLQST